MIRFIFRELSRGIFKKYVTNKEPLTHVCIRSATIASTPTLKSDRGGTGWTVVRGKIEHRQLVIPHFSRDAESPGRPCCTCNVISRGVSSTPLLLYRRVSGSFNKICPRLGT